MASKTRKVSFYRLSLEKQTPIPGTNTVQVKQLSDSEIEVYFQRICAEKMQALANGHKAMNITVSSSRYVIEVISNEDHRALSKLVSRILRTQWRSEIERHWRRKVYL